MSLRASRTLWRTALKSMFTHDQRRSDSSMVSACSTSSVRRPRPDAKHPSASSDKDDAAPSENGVTPLFFRGIPVNPLGRSDEYISVTTSGHHGHGMLKRPHYTGPVLARRLLAAGKIQHQRTTALHAKRPGKHRERRDGQAVSPHGFGDAGHIALANVHSRFGRNVARRSPLPPQVSTISTFSSSVPRTMAAEMRGRSSLTTT